MGILFETLMTYVRERIIKAKLTEIEGVQQQSSEENNGQQFMELLLRIFETKIFPIHKVNFMQYLPIYVMAIG